MIGGGGGGGGGGGDGNGAEKEMERKSCALHVDKEEAALTRITCT
jgi:hypothetical protein